MRRAILLALCVVLPSTTMGQGILGRLFGGGFDAGNLERQYRVIKGRKLGAFLAGKFAGKRAVVLLPPEVPVMGDAGERPHVAVLAGLKAELKGVQIVGMIEPKMPAAVKAKIMAAGGEGDMMIMPETQMWFGVKKLNKELEAYKGKYDLLICLTGLPGVQPMMMGGKKVVSYHELNVWKDKRISVAIAEGGIGRFRSRIESGSICAVVAGKRQIPDADYEKRPAKDLDEAFGTRFVLIASENVAEYAEYFPRRR